MTVDPIHMNKEDLDRLRVGIGAEYGINLHQQYKEREAARLLIAPSQRPEGHVDVSTLKRKRRNRKIAFVPRGDGSIAYVGMMLCDFIAFGERSIFLWGVSGDQDGQQVSKGDGGPSG